MSATQVEGKEERNVSGGIGKRIMRGITKFLLLVLVPIIAAAAIIGVSLQLIGVPVWQTTLGYLQGQSGQAPPSALAQEEASLSPSTASKVLGAMDPASAAKLLQLAGASDANAVGGNSTG